LFILLITYVTYNGMHIKEEEENVVTKRGGITK